MNEYQIQRHRLGLPVTEVPTRTHTHTGSETVSGPHALPTDTLVQLIDGYERKLKPWRKLWALIVGLGVAVAFIFGIGVSYQQFRGGNATKDDVKYSIDTHVQRDLMPVKANVQQIKTDVQQIKTDLMPVKAGVQSWIAEQNAEREIRKAKRKLDRYDKEYQEALQEYTADKAAGRQSTRPRKSQSHIDLEAYVQDLEEML